MKIELLTVGTELLLGFTIDTNGAEIARSLASIGVVTLGPTAEDAELVAFGIGEDQPAATILLPEVV